MLSLYIYICYNYIYMRVNYPFVPENSIPTISALHKHCLLLQITMKETC